MVKILGSLQDLQQVDQLIGQAHQWIRNHLGQSEIDFHGENQEPGKTIDTAKTIYAIKVVTPLNKDEIHQTLTLNEEQEMRVELFNF